MDDNAVLRPTGRYRQEDFGDEVALYDVETSEVINLNESATLVWRLCDGEHSVADIRGLLQAAFPDASAQIEEDLRATVGKLLKHGALEPA